MIKIEIMGQEAVLIGETWTCENNEEMANMLNGRTERRPFRYEPRIESAVARYVVSQFKHKNAKIIFDSEEGKRSTRGEPRADGLKELI